MRIIYKNEIGGISVVIPADGVSVEKLIETVVPKGVEYDVVEDSAIPTDRTFRGAWEKNGNTIIHNLDKAKNIAHDKRRQARQDELAPLDVLVTVPGKEVLTEASRQAIREKYALLQVEIDSAKNVNELKALLPA